MAMLSRYFVALGLALVLLPAQAERGEQKQVFGDYEVHYIGLNSSFLAPDVAKIYDIPRSGALGYVNITLLKKDAPAAGKESLSLPVGATIKGEIRNLVGQSRSLAFREVRERSGVYYISTFRFDDGDMYNFKLTVSPEQAKYKKFDVKFSQRFYQE